MAGAPPLSIATTAALMYTALLSSQVATACLHFTSSVPVQVMSPVALENLRNEMRPDPVPALATQCTRIPLHEVAFRQRAMASFLASSSLQIQRT